MFRYHRSLPAYHFSSREEIKVVVTLPDGNKLSIPAKSQNKVIDIVVKDHLNTENHIARKTSTDKNKATKSIETEKPPLFEKKYLKNKKHTEQQNTVANKSSHFEFTGIPPSIGATDKKIELPKSVSKGNKFNSPTKKLEQPNKPRLPGKAKINTVDSKTSSNKVDGILPAHMEAPETVQEHVPEERPEDDYELIDPSDVMRVWLLGIDIHEGKITAILSFLFKKYIFNNINTAVDVLTLLMKISFFFVYTTYRK